MVRLTLLSRSFTYIDWLKKSYNCERKILQKNKRNTNLLILSFFLLMWSKSPPFLDKVFKTKNKRVKTPRLILFHRKMILSEYENVATRSFVF